MIATIIQAIITGVIFFILYRYLLDELGVEKIGIWSLVLATASVSHIGSLGLSAGIVRYVSQALGQNKPKRAGKIIQTVTLTLSIFVAILLIICYPLFVKAITYLLPAHGLTSALTILPYALLSLWATIISSIFTGGLDACQRIDLRCILLIFTHIMYLGLVILWVPTYGLEGVALAQVTQSFGLMIMSWLVLRYQLPILPLIPYRWKFSILKELFKYGAQFQAIGIMNMFFDPVTKGLISKFSGLEALGYYEMANKLIRQGRSVIVEANRVIVPTVSIMQIHEPKKITQLFLVSYQITFYISVLFYVSLGVFLPIILYLWVGEYEPIFLQFALLLNFGWFVNTLISPAFFANLGTGELKLNLISHIIISTIGFSMGLTLGSIFDAIGVVIGSMLGLISGSLFLLIFHMKNLKLYWLSIIIPRDMWIILFISMASIWLANYINDAQWSLSKGLIIGGISVTCIFIISWYHPTRKLLIQRAQ